MSPSKFYFQRVRTKHLSPDQDIDVELYALRRLNPFRGTRHVIDTGVARAWSDDAVTWLIQIRVRLFHGPKNDSENDDAHFRWMAFATWTASGGLTEFPWNPPGADHNAISEAGGRCVELVQQYASSAPFDFIDHHELWLTDKQTGEPVALVQAEVESPDSTGKSCLQPEWRPLDRFHNADCFESREVFARLRDAHKAIRQLVEQRCANNYVWINAAATTTPELLLTTHWTDESGRYCAKEYLECIAPVLLALPLSHQTRHEVELASASNPQAVARLYRLYPALADEALINSLRVQSALMDSL